MTSKERVLARERERGRLDAVDLQSRAADMDGTALYAEEDKIPGFRAACSRMNMLHRPVGFVCRSSAGRVVALLQNYDSTIYTQEPEELSAQWRFKWSKDPAKALPFVSLATSPYATGDCCTHEGRVWRSGMDGNIWAPGTVNIPWDDLGTTEEIIKGVV